MDLKQAQKLMNDLRFNLLFKTHYSMKKEDSFLENYEECIDRCINMHKRNFDGVVSEKEIDYHANQIYHKHMFPSMRSLQFGGDPINKRNERMYNCGYTHITTPTDFKDINSLLMCGVGIGYSVQKQYVNKLPRLRGKQIVKKEHVIKDSVIGWSDAFYQLLCSYFYGSPYPVFNYSKIREKGSDISSGGRCPGYEPLKLALEKIDKVLEKRANEKGNKKLTTLEVHDIVCIMADSVIAGGVRRSALISLFDYEDILMRECKYDGNIQGNEHRRRANNSIIELVTKVFANPKFGKELVSACKTGRGDPGLYLTKNLAWGCNPCVEAALRSKTFCNKTVVNNNLINSMAEFRSASMASVFFGTLQSAYTSFPLINHEWCKNTSQDRLLGCSMNSISGSFIDEVSMLYPSGIKEVVADMVKYNKILSKQLGIPASKRVTFIAPEGTTSTLFGCASGINDYYAEQYSRGFSLNSTNHPELVELMYEAFPEMIQLSDQTSNLEKNEHFIRFLIQAPDEAPTSETTSLEDNLKRIKRYYDCYIKPGHVSGDNTHTISNTIHLRSEDEWEAMPELIREYRDNISALAMFDYSSPYDQPESDLLIPKGYPKCMPLARLSKEQYRERLSYFKTRMEELERDKGKEFVDKLVNVDVKSENSHKYAGVEVVSCIGGACERV